MNQVIRLADPITDLERCPQCGAYKPTLNFVHADIDYRAGHIRGPGWAIYRCSGCYDIVSFFCTLSRPAHGSNWSAHFTQHNIFSNKMLPASQDSIAADLPERAANYLQQAVNSLNVPDGAVMLSGSAVDAMLKEKGYKDGSVYQRIEKAVADHLLTADMGKWAHAVRLQANQPRHADLDDPHATKEQARQAVEFAKALGDFLFVLPARIASGTQAAEAASDLATQQ